MADKTISEGLNKASLLTTDMIPVAQAGSALAWKVTGETLFNSLPASTTSARGTVELATAAETAAAADTERAVTPASLAAGVGPLMMKAGWCYAGSVATSTPGVGDFWDLFNTAFGRSPVTGDLMVAKDSLDKLYVLVWSDAAGGWFGVKLNTALSDSGEFKSYT